METILETLRPNGLDITLNKFKAEWRKLYPARKRRSRKQKVLGSFGDGSKYGDGSDSQTLNPGMIPRNKGNPFMKRISSFLTALFAGLFAAYGLAHYCIAATYKFSPNLGPCLFGSPNKFCLYSPLVVAKWYKEIADNHDLYNHVNGDVLYFVPALTVLAVGFLLAKLRPNSGKSKEPKIDQIRGMARVDNPKAYFKLAKLKIPAKNRGILIHQNVPLPYSAESEGIAILGGTGSGKTKSVVNLIVKEAFERGDKIIVLDSKGDFTAAFEGEENVHLLAPWDTRSVQWDIGADMPRKTLDAEMVGNAILPPIPNDHQPIFRNAALNILTGTLASLHLDNKLSWASLNHTLSDLDLLIPALEKYDSGRQGLAAVSGSPQTAANFMSNLLTSTGWLKHLAKAWPNPSFSLRSWMRDGKGGMLILRYAADFPELSGSLCSMVTAITIAELLSWTVDKETPVWFVLDEIANLNKKISTLANGITAGRERGGRFVLCTQDVSRLFSIYGHDEAKSILNSLRTLVAFWAGDKTNAEYAADCLGAEQEQRMQTYSDGMSSNNARVFDKSVSHQESVHLRMSKLVLPSELGDLQKGEAFLRVPGLPIARLKWPMTKFEAKYPHEQIAPWVHAPETPNPPSEESTKAE